jgi:hypothetical protein
MGYTLYEREGKKGKSFRVLLRHHSRFLKIQESRTFPTKREAIAWAEEFERTLKTQGQPPFHTLNFSRRPSTLSTRSDTLQGTRNAIIGTSTVYLLG